MVTVERQIQVECARRAAERAPAAELVLSVMTNARQLIGSEMHIDAHHGVDIIVVAGLDECATIQARFVGDSDADLLREVDHDVLHCLAYVAQVDTDANVRHRLYVSSEFPELTSVAISGFAGPRRRRRHLPRLAELVLAEGSGACLASAMRTSRALPSPFWKSVHQSTSSCGNSPDAQRNMGKL